MDHPQHSEPFLLRLGGVSAAVIALGYVAIMALYVPMGAPPLGAEAKLRYIGANATAWWWILGLSVLTDFLFIPVSAALYDVLARYNRAAMLMSTACIALFVLLDLALTWTNYAVLIALSTPSASAAAMPAAAYATLVVESGLLFVYNTLTLAIGLLISGWVMRRARFGRITAWVGIATGCLGIVSVAGPVFTSSLSPAIIVTSVLTTVWLLLTGVRLCQLSRA